MISPTTRRTGFGRRLASTGFIALVVLAWTAAMVPGAAASSTVQLGKRTSSLGTYLTSPNGHALYTLSSEPKNGVLCTGGCLGFWPPLLVASGDTVKGPAGAVGSFGTFVRSDTGKHQASLNGHALYNYSGDSAVADTNGEGISAFGGTWHVAKVTIAVTTYEAVAGTMHTSSAAATLLAKVTKAGFRSYKIEKESSSPLTYEVERTFSTKAAATTEFARLKAAGFIAKLEIDAPGSV